MILVVGLGNPTRRFKETPHNSGFEFVYSLRNELERNGWLVSSWEDNIKMEAQVAKAKKDNKEVIFFLPQTFMNLSGRAVKKILDKHIFSKVIVAHDDLDIALGKYKIMIGKTPKAHNGILDIQRYLDIKKMVFVRLGVDNRKGEKIEGEKYVLMKFKQEEIIMLNEEICSAIKELIPQLIG